jgi:adenylate kinase
MEAGALVSDDIVNRLIDENLAQLSPTQGVIFDGYPRTCGQAESLDGLLGGRGRKLDGVIEIEVDEDALVDRITGRFTCAKCNAGYHDRHKLPRVPGLCDVCGSGEFKRRPDDNEQTVRTRMAEYRAKTAPILPFYEARGLVSRVDGMAAIGEVGAAIDTILEAR